MAITRSEVRRGRLLQAAGFSGRQGPARPRMGTMRLLVLGLLVFALGRAATSDANRSIVPIGRIENTVPTLRSAIALGQLRRIDIHAEFAEFRIKCGWKQRTDQKVRPGVWKVDLHRVSFGWETNPSNPAAPRARVEIISFTKWVRRAQTKGWAGSLRLSAKGGSLSNGPTTDICGGVLG